MTARTCDYYKPVNARSRIVCPNCGHWLNNKCSIERLVKANGKADLVHEPVRGSVKYNQLNIIRW